MTDMMMNLRSLVEKGADADEGLPRPPDRRGLAVPLDRRHPSEGSPERPVVSVAVIVAIGVNRNARREVLGMDTGPSEAEAFWTAFLRKLARRGLRGVKLVISDAPEGIEASVAKTLTATWQRCRVHFMRNALAHAGKNGRCVVSAFIATAFAQNDAEAARRQWHTVADQLRPRMAKLAAYMDEAEPDVLDYPMPPADVFRLLPALLLLQNPNNLLFREP